MVPSTSSREHPDIFHKLTALRMYLCMLSWSGLRVVYICKYANSTAKTSNESLLQTLCQLLEMRLACSAQMLPI